MLSLGHGGGGGHHHHGGGGHHHGGGWYAPEVVVVTACPQVYAPVLGVDGRQYANACYADQAGVAVVKSLGDIVSYPPLVPPIVAGPIKKARAMLRGLAADVVDKTTGPLGLSWPVTALIGLSALGLTYYGYRSLYPKKRALGAPPLCDDPAFARRHPRACR